MNLDRLRSRPPPGAGPPGGQPIVNLPPMVAALIGISVVTYLLLSVLPWRWHAAVLVTLGFIPARYTLAAAIEWPAIISPLTHQFLHGGALHLIINMIMLAAFGTPVERALGKWRMLGLYLTCGTAGAFAHLLIYPTSTVPVIGASGSISGMFGAVLYLMARAGRGTRRSPRLLPIALIWVGFAALTGLTGAPGAEGAQIAWAAHIGGFLAGLSLVWPLAHMGRSNRS